MNIALNREATADKSREATGKTNGQFETLTLDARACGEERGSDARGL